MLWCKTHRSETVGDKRNTDDIASAVKGLCRVGIGGGVQQAGDIARAIQDPHRSGSVSDMSKRATLLG